MLSRDCEVIQHPRREPSTAKQFDVIQQWDHVHRIAGTMGEQRRTAAVSAAQGFAAHIKLATIEGRCKQLCPIAAQVLHRERAHRIRPQESTGLEPHASPNRW